MSTAQVLQQSTLRVTISIQAGPDKGSSYQLLPPMALIGRGAENDIVLTDARCSRNQAVIRFVENTVEIEDVSSRLTTTVNGKSAKIHQLTHGDVIRMGDTELTFQIELPQAVNLTLVPPMAEAAAPEAPPHQTPMALAHEPFVAAPSVPPQNFAPASFQAGPTPQQRMRPPQADNSGRIRFYIICAVIVGGLVYLIQSGNKSDLKDKFALRTAADVEKDIKTSETHQDEIVRKIRTPEAKQRFEEAQAHYLTGFRDYEKGQYARALRSFETARAIDPGHELANRYSVLAERKRDEAITNNMVEGRRYKEKHMFQRCSAALDKVLDEISNTDDIRYKESQALKRECDLMLEGKY